MKRFCRAGVIAALAAAGAVAHAAPPTVTPSPGYDARLQEQRAATSAAAPPATVTSPAPTPVTPRHHKKSKSN